eukprot:350139-Chlamydomonas_euryale.AAC.2
MADADDIVCLDGLRPLRQTAYGTEDLTPVQALDVLQKAKQHGKAKYWTFFRPVISDATGLACLQSSLRVTLLQSVRFRFGHRSCSIAAAHGALSCAACEHNQPRAAARCSILHAQQRDHGPGGGRGAHSCVCQSGCGTAILQETVRQHARR